jgi:hypothetical protein
MATHSRKAVPPPTVDEHHPGDCLLVWRFRHRTVGYAQVGEDARGATVVGLAVVEDGPYADLALPGQFVCRHGEQRFEVPEAFQLRGEGIHVAPIIRRAALRGVAS